MSASASAAAALGASAEAVLRRLEAWAQADAAEEEASEEGAAAVVATGKLEGELTLAAAPRGGAPPGGPAPHAPVATRYELEAYVLDAGNFSNLLWVVFVAFTRVTQHN